MSISNIAHSTCDASAIERPRLRAYQEEFLAELSETCRDIRRRGLVPRVLGVSRTATGKTVSAAELMRRCRENGRRIAFVVRDRTLLDQTSRQLDRFGLTEHGVIAAGHKRSAPGAPIQVCSAQTLTARGEAPEADVLIFDEAHGIVCDTSRAIVAAYPHATIIGLTATPERGDGQALGEASGGVFNAMVVVRVTFAELVAQGALVDCDVIGPTGGKATRELCEDPIVALKRHCHGKKTVIYGIDRAHADDLSQRAAAAGFRAASIDGSMSDAERDRLLKRIGLPASDPDAINVLTNCDLLIQGWDCPPVEVGIIARGCEAWSTWIQICGRLLRPIPLEQRHLFSKDRALIVDLRGNVFVHGHPGEEREFSLSGTASKPVDKTPKLRCCPKCGLTLRATPVCRACGFQMPAPPRPVVKRQAMAPVVAVATEAERRAFFEKCVREARRRGYNPKWASMRYLETFGRWPKYNASNVTSEVRCA